MLTEAIMGKTTAQINQMKQAYQSRYGRSLEADVRSDLSFKTLELFQMALTAKKPEEWVQPNPQAAQSDARSIYEATKGRIGTDEMTVCRILVNSSNIHIRAIAYEYNLQHGPLVDCIKKEFSGHMKDALVYIVEGATDPVKRDAVLLEASMKGFGTKDDLLISRLVRAHWNRIHLESVKNAYRSTYHKELRDRVKGETSGDYRDMLLTMIG